MPPPERVEAKALDTLTDGVRTARLRLLLLLLILLGTITDATPDLRPPSAESESPASEDGQEMADPLNNLGAEPTHAGYSRGSARLHDGF